MVKTLQEASGDHMSYRVECNNAVKFKPPTAVYKLYKDYGNRLQSDEILARSKKK